jgi:hypothetical protein
MNDINETDLGTLQGGAIPWIVTVTGGALIVAIINGWADFKAGYTEAYIHQTGEPPL